MIVLIRAGGRPFGGRGVGLVRASSRLGGRVCSSSGGVGG